MVILLLETRFLITAYDPLITDLLQNNLPRLVDIPFSFFSLFGSFEITTLLVFLVMVFVFTKEKVVLWSMGFFVFFHIFEIIGKIYLFHPGPPLEYFRYSLPFHISTVYIQTNYAFPSGHVGRTLFLTAIAIFLINRYIRNSLIRRLLSLILITVVILMAISRIYLGEHWTSDVLGGIFLGTAMGVFTLVYYPRKDYV